jgi:hypothetical protein
MAEIPVLLEFNDFDDVGIIIAKGFQRSHRLWSPLKIVLAPLDGKSRYEASPPLAQLTPQLESNHWRSNNFERSTSL